MLFDYVMVYSRPIFLRKSSVGGGKIKVNVYPFGDLFIERKKEAWNFEKLNLNGYKTK